jgi:hypothetical protein
MMFVEPDNTLLSGAVVEDKPVRRVNRDEGSPKSGQKPSGLGPNFETTG